MKLLLSLCFILVALLSSASADYLGGFPQIQGGAVLNVAQYPTSTGDYFKANGTLFSIGSQTAAFLPLNYLLVYAQTERVPEGTTCTLRIIEACYGGSKAATNQDLNGRTISVGISTLSSAAVTIRSNMDGWLNFTFPTPYSWGVGDCKPVSLNHVNLANISCGSFKDLEIRSATYEDANTANAGAFTYNGGRLSAWNTKYRSVFSHCYSPDECSPHNNNCTRCRQNSKCKYCTGGQCRSSGDYCQADSQCLRCPLNPTGVITPGGGDAGTDTKCCPPGNVLQDRYNKYCCAVPIPCADDWRWTGTQCCPEKSTVTGSDGKKTCCRGPVTWDGRTRYCCAGVTSPVSTTWGASGTNRNCCPAKNVLTQGNNKYCCPSDVSAGGWTWTGSACCLESQMVLGSDGKKACCIGQVTIGTDGRTRYCCPTTIPKPGCTHRGHPGTNTFCCPTQNTLTSGTVKYCCPQDVSGGGWIWTGSQCCPSKQVTTGSDGSKTCCTGVTTPWWTPTGDRDTNPKCCPQKNVLIPTGSTNKYCCKQDVSAGGWTWTGQCCPSSQTFKGADGKPYCCPAAQISSTPNGKDSYCCPPTIKDPTWTNAGEGNSTFCCPKNNTIKSGYFTYCCKDDVSAGGWGWTGKQCCPSDQIAFSERDPTKTKYCCPKGVSNPTVTTKGDAGTYTNCCPQKNVYTDKVTGTKYCCKQDVSGGGWTWAGEQCCKTSEAIGNTCCPADRISTNGNSKNCCPPTASKPVWTEKSQDSSIDAKCCPPKFVVTDTTVTPNKKYCCVQDITKGEWGWTGDKCCIKGQITEGAGKKYCCPNNNYSPQFVSEAFPCCPLKNTLVEASGAKHCCPDNDVSGGGWTWSAGQCCPPAQSFSGETGTACCPADHISTSPDGKSKYCCPTTANPVWTSEGDKNVNTKCCPRANFLEIGGDSYCCAQAVDDGWTWTGSQCCPAAQTTTSPTGYKKCCPTTSPVWTTNDACCPWTSVLYIGGTKYCCPSNIDLSTGDYGWTGTECCPEDQIFKGTDGSNSVCCPVEQITTGPIKEGQCEPPRYCCPNVKDPVYIPGTPNPYPCCPEKNVLADADGKTKYCCPNPVDNGGYEWIDAQCCPSGQITSYGGVKKCCPENVQAPQWTPYGERDVDKQCCPSANVYTAPDNKKYCCPQEIKKPEDWAWTGDKCCPAAQTTYSDDGKTVTCCPSNIKEPMWTPNGDDGATACCPKEYVTTDANGKNYCCVGAVGSPSYTENQKCCPATKVLRDEKSGKKYCCPQDVNEGLWYWTGDETKCCPSTQTTTMPNGDVVCCPSTYDPEYTPNDKCCPASQVTTSPTDSKDTYCCPYPGQVWTNKGDSSRNLKCCPADNVLTQYDAVDKVDKKYCCDAIINNNGAWVWTGATCCPSDQTIDGTTCCPKEQISQNPLDSSQQKCCVGVTDPRWTPEGPADLPSNIDKYCCPAKNVLTQGGIKYCCPQDVNTDIATKGSWSWTGSRCCPPENSVPTYSGFPTCCPAEKITTSTDGKNTKSCCIDVAAPIWTSTGENGTNPACCPTSHVIGSVCCVDDVSAPGWTWTGEQCCPPAQSVKNSDQKDICCPLSQIVWDDYTPPRKSCCIDVEEPVYIPPTRGETGSDPKCCPSKNVLTELDGKKYCCPKPVTDDWDPVWVSSVCCPRAQTTQNPANSASKKCCIGVSRPVWTDGGENTKSIECCPSDYVLTVQDKEYCCYTNFSNPTTPPHTWIPESSKCCPTAQVVQMNGKSICCPLDRLFDAEGTKICCLNIEDPKLVNNSGVYSCCPGKYTNYFSTACCLPKDYPLPMGSTQWNSVTTNYSSTYSEKCCPSTYTQPGLTGDSYCCPGNTTAGAGSYAQYGPTTASESNQFQASVCCPISKTLNEVQNQRYCCDKSWFGPGRPTTSDVRWIDGKCCPAGSFVTNYTTGRPTCCPPTSANGFNTTKNVLCCPRDNATQISEQVTVGCACILKYPYCCPNPIDHNEAYWFAPNVSDITKSPNCCPKTRVTEDYSLCCPDDITNYPGASKWVKTDLQNHTNPLWNELCCPDTHKSICVPGVPKTSCCPEAYSWSGLILATGAPSDFFYCCPPDHVVRRNGEAMFCCKDPKDPVEGGTIWDETNKRCNTDLPATQL